MVKKEQVVKKFNYRQIRLTPRPRPDRKENIIIIPMLSEFGCETLGVLYSIPELLRNRWSGKYIIVLSWFGREYLYRGLADEVWELAEEHQWLKQYCLAFHHVSRNLKRFEQEMAKFGTMIQIGTVSNVCVFPKLTVCPSCKGAICYERQHQMCVRCGKKFDPVGLFQDLRGARERVRWPASPSTDALKRVKDFLPKNAIGINARNRKTYDRNLSIDFYKRLIFEIEDMGYSPVWFGEPSSIHKCPFDRIPDFSVSPLAANLENTFALVSQMKFTIQAYTASSRLAALTGTPFLIVESPEQVWGTIGQEGMRLNLMSKTNRRKLIVCQFLDAKNRPIELMELILTGVEEIENEDYSDMIGLVSNKSKALSMKMAQAERIGEFLRDV